MGGSSLTHTLLRPCHTLVALSGQHDASRTVKEPEVTRGDRLSAVEPQVWALTASDCGICCRSPSRGEGCPEVSFKG